MFDLNYINEIQIIIISFAFQNSIVFKCYQPTCLIMSYLLAKNNFDSHLMLGEYKFWTLPKRFSSFPCCRATKSHIQLCSLTWAPWHWWHCLTDRYVWCNWSRQHTGYHRCPMREQQEPAVCFPPPAHYSLDRRCFCACHSPLWCW